MSAIARALGSLPYVAGQLSIETESGHGGGGGNRVTGEITSHMHDKKVTDTDTKSSVVETEL